MIIRHDRSDRDCLVDEQQWPALTSFFHGHGAASLIAPTWLLTAAHVAQIIPAEIAMSVEHYTRVSCFIEWIQSTCGLLHPREKG